MADGRAAGVLQPHPKRSYRFLVQFHDGTTKWQDLRGDGVTVQKGIWKELTRRTADGAVRVELPKVQKKRDLLLAELRTLILEQEAEYEAVFDRVEKFKRERFPEEEKKETPAEESAEETSGEESADENGGENSNAEASDAENKQSKGPINKNKQWLPEEDQAVLRFVSRHRDQEDKGPWKIFAEKLGRSLFSLEQRAMRLDDPDAYWKKHFKEKKDKERAQREMLKSAFGFVNKTPEECAARAAREARIAELKKLTSLGKKAKLERRLEREAEEARKVAELPLVGAAGEKKATDGAGAQPGKESSSVKKAKKPRDETSKSGDKKAKKLKVKA